MIANDGDRRRVGLAGIGLVVLLLTALSTLAVALATRDSGSPRDGSSAANGCTAPQLPGSVVHVDLRDMGSGNMGGGGMMGSGRGAMGFTLSTDQRSVASGSVSFAVTNHGRLTHELVVLPLPAGGAGTRSMGADGKVDEAQSFGEASRACGAGEGDGITSGSTGWVTLNLAPGRYELVCNEPGHYAAGMFAELTVN